MARWLRKGGADRREVGDWRDDRRLDGRRGGHVDRFEWGVMKELPCGWKLGEGARGK